MIEALHISVRGIVQGVGFRPFVYKLAKRYLITGWVLNSLEGVTVHAEGEAKLLDEFVLEIAQHHPAAAKVDEVELKEVPLEGFETFEIRFSDEEETTNTTLISSDLATCPDCERELFDPRDRRFRYPFINCTNCGPRFTIIESLPYDRKRTSMKDFEMCGLCRGEYDDPLDRRFHAQPDACFDCGPRLTWRVVRPSSLEASDDSRVSAEVSEASLAPAEASDDSRVSAEASASSFSAEASDDSLISAAVRFLREGKILAVKGLGGFHLACDASNEEAIAKLRERKRRAGKPFAVMLPGLEQAKRYCEVNAEEEALLSGAQRPIVLLKKKRGMRFAAGLADDLPELGVMLPYTPVQHLLLRDFGGMLVMTSGNFHDDPIVIDDGEAYEVLRGIADAFLGNDRAIRARYDDSVVRVIRIGENAWTQQMIRRARGYAPTPLALEVPASSVSGVSDLETNPPSSPAPSDLKTNPPSDPSPSDLDSSRQVSVFATGPEQKNSFCLTRPGEAFVSQHIGDVEQASTFDAWLDTKARYERLFALKPTLVACDRHPEYLTSKWAHEQQELPVVAVQHHHAHIVSVMAENGIEAPVCGFAFDGTGYGVDGSVWGGEVLLCNRKDYERFANFCYLPMPGGAAAIRKTGRMAYGALWAFDLLEHPAAQEMLEEMGEEASLCARMIERGLNTPVTSSLGRLFDAASALLGICRAPKYEGEAAILLEAALAEKVEDKLLDLEERYHIDLVKNSATAESTAFDTSVLLLDAAPLFGALLDDKQRGVAVGTIAKGFHDAIVSAMVQIAEVVRSSYDIETFALSGGVFLNRYLVENAIEKLTARGFRVALNRELPPGDGCISFGQAVVALNSYK